jgi:predicted phosphodiesterase
MSTSIHRCSARLLAYSSCLTLLCFSAGGCSAAAQAPPRAIAQSATDAFRVIVLGDMPYHGPGDPAADSMMRAYDAVLDTVRRERAAFVVHIGDITMSTCTDSLYQQRLREFRSIPKPVFYTFGDNEWTDCRSSGADPLERLARLRAIFTAGDSSLGGTPWPLTRQSGDARFSTYRENVRWTAGGVVFATIHMTGSANNRGRDTTGVPPEFTARTAANEAWLAETFRVATESGARGVAIFTQANPGLALPWNRYAARNPDGFKTFLDTFQRLAVSFGKPVALVHGDTHYFRVDQPFHDTERRTIPNIVRAETFGTPNMHAILMTVSPLSPNVFTFEPLHVRANRLQCAAPLYCGAP